jgi:hypothetical protein
MIRLSKEILNFDSKSARWIANDAIRELSSEKVQNRLVEKKEKENRKKLKNIKKKF